MAYRGPTLLDRALSNGHGGGVLWLTGRPGAGKSSLSRVLEADLFACGYQVAVLDGDELRAGLTRNLSFSPKDRTENARLTAVTAKLFVQAGLVVIVALISPYAKDRAMVKGLIGKDFHEIHVDADLPTCESRDPKGLYALARTGTVKSFTGVSAPYEAPVSPDLRLDTMSHTIEQCSSELLVYVQAAFPINKDRRTVHG